MSNSSIEILGARERRRRWSVEEKLRIVAETEEPGASLRAVAKLGGQVELVAPGTLPNDGKVIADER